MKRYLKYLFVSLVSCLSILFSMDKVSAKGGFYSSLSSILNVVETQSFFDSSTIVQQDTVKKKHIVSADGSSKSFFSSWFFQPFRSTQPSQAVASMKLLSNVKVFPNPTVESINLSFRLSKRAEVTIKVMDALGNEIMQVLNQTIDSGNHSHNFDIQGKLSSGVYFVRLTSGTETVVKRISVL